ncbi:unnamed protein product [Gulo gulo]|uniref:Uncharacterized protein n=1 Tax=Gulo gulo TaxID=48420 RepID=A0A9X9LJU1_GULGU|nr:unnamed protein product [Gulo gulo]
MSLCRIWKSLLSIPLPLNLVQWPSLPSGPSTPCFRQRQPLK